MHSLTSQKQPADRRIKFRIMKKGILVLALLGAFNFGFAQDGPEGPDREGMEKLSPQEKAEKTTEKMAKVLNLTDEQKEKVLQINLDHAKEMESIRDEGKKLKDKAKEQKESTRDDIESVLTEEQLAIMKEKEEERKQKRREKCKCCQDR